MASGQFNRNKAKRHIPSMDTNHINDIQYDVDSMVHDGKFTEIANKYIKYLLKHFNRHSEYNLKKFILELPASEKWLLVLDYDYDHVKYFRDNLSIRSTEILLNTLSEEDSGFFMHEADNHRAKCYVPSVSLIHYLFRIQFPDHLKMFFCFGQVNEKTLHQMHQDNHHPLPLYNPYVTSNLTKAHNYQCGPLLVWMHDIGHTFWGSYLTYQERQIVLNNFSSIIAKIQNKLLSLGVSTSGKYNGLLKNDLCEYMNNRLIDFELIGYYERPTLGDYLHSCIFSYLYDNINYMVSTNQTPAVGQLLSDKFSLAIDSLLKDSSLTTAEVVLFKSFREALYPITSKFLMHSKNLLQAISQVAEVINLDQLNSRQKLRLSKIDLSTWTALFNSSKTDIEIWKAIIGSKELYRDYKILCINIGLKFLPPFHVSTNEKREQYIAIFSSIPGQDNHTTLKRARTDNTDVFFFKKKKFSSQTNLKFTSMEDVDFYSLPSSK